MAAPRLVVASILAAVSGLATPALAQDAPAQPAAPEQKQPAANDSGYISLTPAEFAERAPDLVGKQVEVSGDIIVPRMMSPRSVGTINDKDGKVLVQLIAKPGSAALAQLVGGGAKTQGVFARGTVAKVRDQIVLDLSDVSKESKVQAAAAVKAKTESVSDQDKAGLVKEVLPPHTNPTGEAAKAWLDRVPPTSPQFDRAKSVWDNMQTHAKWRGQTDADDRRAILRGPDRPANFETYYRGVRDTGLKDLFKDAPYKNGSTAWPRVMIVIEEKPVLHGSMPSEYWHNQGSKTETDYTWRYRAVVWTDADHKVEIGPFNWAFSEMRFNTPYSEVEIWGRTPKLNVPHAETVSTGPDAAPVPLKYPLPDTPEYHRLFDYRTIMVGNVLLDMGFNYNKPDGRVWFVEDLAKDAPK